MLQFFHNNNDNSCNIVLHHPIDNDNIDSIENLLSRDEENIRYILNFGRIYTINKRLISLLYNAIFEKHQSIHIITHKAKLNKYLHKLGFTTEFVSLLKDDVVDVSEIKVVVIGGSADSSYKIMKIVRNISLENLSLIIVQHTQPDKKTFFDEILETYTKYKVSYPKDGEKLEKSKIYLSPNNEHLLVENGRFKLSSSPKYNYSRPSISLSYESFAQEYKNSLLVIQECGYAQDGVDKLNIVHKNSAHIIVQDADECSAKSMVTKAITTGFYDYILNTSNIILYLNFLDANYTPVEWVEYLLDMIYKQYAYDFRLYQRDMIERRLKIFMLKHEIKLIKNAIGIIVFNKTAFKSFFLEISINVTEFFRDPQSYEEIASFISKTYKNSRNIKIWSAGCSSGKEAYSLAMLLEYFDKLKKSIIYATDFNNVILDEARSAVYSIQSYEIAQKNINKLSIDIKIDDFLLRNDNFIAIKDEIMQNVLFLQHNLATDSSFNEFDIIICKNVIIYFDNNLQKKVFQLLYDSLRFGGHLVIGESEFIHIDFESKFERLSDNHKIYKKVD